MVTAQRQGNDSDSRVLVSSKAANMISSLHRFNKARANSTLAKIKLSVQDPAKVQKIAGVENAFVARSGDLRVVFKKDGDTFVITSIVAKSGRW